MNQPHLNFTSLPRESAISHAGQQSDGLSIWYLGQVGFILQQRGLTIAIDPYLTGSVDRLEDQPKDLWLRSYPPPFDPKTLTNLDLVLCTHDHMDHTDPETLQALAKASPQCCFAGPRVSLEEMKKAGIASERLILLNEGKSLSFRDAVIEPVAAAHEDYETDAEGHHRFLGYLLHWHGLTVFHSGDTVVTPRLAQSLSRYQIDIGFLPINGRSELRHQQNIVGNSDSREVMELASELNFDLLVPTHYDLYKNNGAPLADFAAQWELQPFHRRPKFKAFRPGEKILYRKTDRSRALAIIIGAGKTGRGFLARLLEVFPYEVVFVDRDEKLVQRLNEDGGYGIHFFGGQRPAFRIGGVSAAVAGSDLALEWMSHAAVVFTAVGESNIAGLVPRVRQALELRREKGAPKLRFLVCENGASPAAPLREAFGDRPHDIEIGEAAIFCSTIELPGTRLDIQSEPYDQLPFDSERISEFSGFAGMKPVANFPTLLRRKIYTYNCYSACIAYLGAYKKYQWYADAASDTEISVVLDRVARPLNEAIVRAFHVDPGGQQEFSDAALRKFRDQNIRDDIARNARGVARKLSPNDRLIAPARMILENGGEVAGLALTMAAALLYRGPDEAKLAASLEEKPAAEVFAEISGYPPESAVNQLVAHYYQLLKDPRGRSLLEILNLPVNLTRP